MKITIPYNPPSLNKIINANRYANAKLKKDWSNIMWFEIYRSINETGASKFKDKVHMKIIINFKTKGRRDWDNFIGGLKYLIDPLVENGVIKDDSRKIITKFDVEMNLGTGKPNETIIEISEEK